MKFVLKVFLSVAGSCLALGARAYTLPSIRTTLKELKTIKGSLNQEPCEQGYAVINAWNP